MNRCGAASVRVVLLAVALASKVAAKAANSLANTPAEAAGGPSRHRRRVQRDAAEILDRQLGVEESCVRTAVPKQVTPGGVNRNWSRAPRPRWRRSCRTRTTTHGDRIERCNCVRRVRKRLSRAGLR